MEESSPAHPFILYLSVERILIYPKVNHTLKEKCATAFIRLYHRIVQLVKELLSGSMSVKRELGIKKDKLTLRRSRYIPSKTFRQLLAQLTRYQTDQSGRRATVITRIAPYASLIGDGKNLLPRLNCGFLNLNSNPTTEFSENTAGGPHKLSSTVGAELLYPTVLQPNNPSVSNKLQLAPKTLRIPSPSQIGIKSDYLPGRRLQVIFLNTSSDERGESSAGLTAFQVQISASVIAAAFLARKILHWVKKWRIKDLLLKKKRSFPHHSMLAITTERLFSDEIERLKVAGTSSVNEAVFEYSLEPENSAAFPSTEPRLVQKSQLSDSIEESRSSHYGEGQNLSRSSPINIPRKSHAHPAEREWQKGFHHFYSTKPKKPSDPLSYFHLDDVDEAED
ncbi:hypothetical protein O181_042338 [Austropuccinia psidii MF-1]|uniref:Uncharacterized protein n=1 Tax=Austropuccinia psidii MF-1 TaxID=1389203 RepID=A0A9Q3DJ76_9BASI|nr:hypothetical protein [Austropuccinia psidii MF-1]